ncbi:MAG: alpha-ketoacid dehydrogenase subunit beta [Anaerolineae bacterium]|nr:alpha-ketoacid dehydrogenase subunit beta [Anaerolineae bacterium]MCK4470279.1 alpha-ketoacid dehydrogenase subunit beta [Anaerolineae bacterium]
MMREITFAEAINEGLREEMMRDPMVVTLGEDIAAIGGNFGITKGLLDEFGPARVKDTPISEDAIVGLSLGASMVGVRPVAEIMFSTFLGCCMEELSNQVGAIRYMNGGQITTPVVIRTCNSLGRSGAAQHSGRNEAWIVHTPGIKVVIPSTPYDAKGLLKTAIRADDPVVFFEHALLYYQAKGPVPEEEYTIPFGVADVKREGDDVTIVAYQLMVRKALEAAEILAAEGIEAEVVDPRTLVPLDVDTIVESVKKTNRLIIASEECGRAGVNGEIAFRVIEEAFDYLDAPIARVTAANVPVPFSPPLEEFIMPKVEDIVEAARRLMG